MGTYSPILNMPLVQANQTQKELTINSALAILEQAGNSQISYSGAAGNVTPNQDQWTTNIYHIVTGATAAITFTIPATPRMFVFQNAGATQPITIGCAGAASGSATLVVASGKTVLAITDGANVVAVSSGVGRLQDLSDVNVLTTAPTAGQVLTWNASANDWVPATPASGGANDFTQLQDTPHSYAGSAGLLVQVNTSANGLQFVDPKAFTRYTVDQETAAFTLALTDENRLKQVASSSGVAVTVPDFTTAAFTVGATISFQQVGGGQITLTPSAGVTLNYPPDMTPITRTTNSVISLTNVGQNQWLVVGDLAQVVA